MESRRDTAGMNPAHHTPVMLDRIVELMRPAVAYEPRIIVDTTLGLGGHAFAVLQAFDDVHLIGIDRDHRAIDVATKNLATFSDRIELVNAAYDELAEVLCGRQVSAILFDLGVSSMQLDTIERGFSYAHNTPLDMRMNQTDSKTAADLLAQEDPKTLEYILARYGQEKFARKIAQTIVQRRSHTPFTHSAQLVDAVRASIPAPARRSGGNPAKRTFQALRIAVNDELSILQRAIPQSLDALALGGRVISMAYHSGEDKIIKTEFASRVATPGPRDMPVVPEELKPRFGLVTRGAEQASADEIAQNRRAKSVRVRAIQRLKQ